VKEQETDIKRAGSQPSAKGPSDWFTGLGSGHSTSETESGRRAHSSSQYRPKPRYNKASRRRCA